MKLLTGDRSHGGGSWLAGVSSQSMVNLLVSMLRGILQTEDLVSATFRNAAGIFKGYQAIVNLVLENPISFIFFDVG